MENKKAERSGKMEEEIKALLETFRRPFQADGGDLILDKLEAGKMKLRIVVGEEGCRECIMPPDVVQEIITSNLKETLGLNYEVTVTIEDI